MLARSLALIDYSLSRLAAGRRDKRPRRHLPGPGRASVAEGGNFRISRQGVRRPIRRASARMGKRRHVLPPVRVRPRPAPLIWGGEMRAVLAHPSRSVTRVHFLRGPSRRFRGASSRCASQAPGKRGVGADRLNLSLFRLPFACPRGWINTLLGTCSSGERSDGGDRDKFRAFLQSPDARKLLTKMGAASRALQRG